MIAAFKMDEAYFKESLNEWTWSISKGRKYEPFLCGFSFLIGVAVYLFLPKFRLVGIAAVAVGLLESWKYMRFRKHWLRQRFESKEFNQDAEFLIESGVVKQLKPDLKTLIEPTPCTVLPSRRGYFVYPKLGAFLYIPHAAITPAVSREEVMNSFRN
jgi:hypothetical protein